MREITLNFDPERKLFLYFGLALLTAVTGPFGTYGVLSFWQRVIFWSLDVVGGLAIIVPVLHVVFRARWASFLPPLARFVTGIALGALPAAGYIMLLYNAISQNLAPIPSYPVLAAEITVFSTALLLFEYVVWPAIFPTVPADEMSRDGPEAVAVPPELAARLPQELRGGHILSISMQDHYAEIATTAGTALVLIRLADAMALLEGVEGTRIHRSHWVARAAVRGLERTGNKHQIRLADGRNLPVSSTYLEAARALVAAG